MNRVVEFLAAHLMGVLYSDLTFVTTLLHARKILVLIRSGASTVRALARAATLHLTISAPFATWIPPLALTLKIVQAISRTAVSVTPIAARSTVLWVPGVLGPFHNLRVVNRSLCGPVP